ncbi:C40 family peptidase [Myceligenerans pegani]|uniref:C40 family peptidase n=1 Tax=Myceligenerans pegani TaxID=2776917 RepID=A0ABR9MV32_9MICO|nr:C40 family peptidase [Myceligenerans sp. TRM 65318]MBE1875239.1 C40 family peptidase [Myceligenerans sp. TRM 65318]MBE3017510.1 C40 family peptidase [Myceligenerans sp. TRM 65318]
MTARTAAGRHRAARRPVTPFTDLVQNSQLGRRTAVAAAAGGILVSTFGAAAAQAAPGETVKSDLSKLGSLDLNALANEAHQVVDAAPVVTVARDAKMAAESGVVSVTPASENEEYQAQLAAEAAAEEAAAAAAAAAEEAAAAEAAAASAATSVPASANGSEIISIASRYVGTPYLSGGSTPSGFDCSGFTAYVYAQVGISLPHSSSAQAAGGTVVPASAAVAGDLIYAPGHIGIYAGGSTMIDAPRPGGTVQFRTIWMSNPTFIRY